ncbi:helix-turn-helix domain-containing protein [Paenibacillus psychroresistens]|nr:helix-turn-helix domain-containing protein [Paenibacillus psychroresistens]
MSNNNHLLTIDEARKILRVGKNVMYSKISEGIIPHIKIGKQIRIPEEQLFKWINQ